MQNQTTIAEQVIPLQIDDLTVAYHERPVLWDVDLSVPAGKLMAIIGPNGAGKSTLIKAALGLVPIASGSIRVFGKTYAESRLRVGYVPQRTSADWDFPTSALDVVTMGTYGRLGWFKRPGKADQAELAIVMNEAADAVEAILADGPELAMTRYNQRA